MRPFFAVVTLCAVVGLAAGCGTSAAPTTTTTGDETVVEGDRLAGLDQLELRRFEVDGAEVFAYTALDDLPTRTTEVVLTGTVIDDGDGPMACLGGVNTSLPPQCGGPIVDGLVMGDWAQTASGVSWGSRTLALTWPPVDGRVTLLAEGEPTAVGREPDPLGLDVPEACADIERFVDVEVLGRWAEANPDRAGVVSVAENRVGVLRVVGDVDEVRAELSDGDAVPCVVPVDYSTNQLRAAQAALRPLLEAGLVTGSGSGNAYNRVTVEVPAADRDTVAQIVAAAGDPGIVRITGTAVVLAGE